METPGQGKRMNKLFLISLYLNKYLSCLEVTYVSLNSLSFCVDFVFTLMLQLLLRKARDLISGADSPWHLDSTSAMLKCFDCLATFLINQQRSDPP